MKSSRTGTPSKTISSHPSWGAWIEICYINMAVASATVAPLMGCVD